MTDTWRGAPPYGVRLDQESVATGPYSSPWDAPLVPPFPMRFRDVLVLTVFWRTDPEELRRLAPPPLEPIGDVVAAHIYKMPDTDFAGALHECNVMFGARLPGPGGVEGGYSTGLYLDSDVGVAHGREVHGQPKKMATLRLDARGDLVVGEVERNGITLLTATLPYKQRTAMLADMRQHFDFSVNINYKLVPNIDGTPAVRQLTSRQLSDVDLLECWTGPGTVELRPNAQAPVWRMRVVEMLEGYFWRANFTLVAGAVLHDYLKDRTT